jgi:hypothetical protein
MLAGELDKAPSTVYSELNPWGDRSKFKLGLEDFIEISRLTGNHEALTLIADLLGYRLVKKTVHPGASTMYEEFHQDTSKVAEFHNCGVAYRMNDCSQADLLKAKSTAIQEIEESYERVLAGDEARQ